MMIKERPIEREMLVPAWCVGMVIGRHGQTLRQIEHDTMVGTFILEEN
jgi:hypothetical protein